MIELITHEVWAVVLLVLVPCALQGLFDLSCLSTHYQKSYKHVYEAITYALQGHSCSPEVPDIMSNHQQPANCRRVCDQGGVFSSWR